MPRSGAVWLIGNQLMRAPAPAWSAQELAKLAKGFIDLDLDGSDLHRWCVKNDVLRTPGAIDKKLIDIGLVGPEETNKPRRKFTWQPSGDPEEAKKLAKKCLKQQVTLAKLEMQAGGPVYKPKR